MEVIDFTLYKFESEFGPMTDEQRRKLSVIMANKFIDYDLLAAGLRKGFTIDEIYSWINQ
jgi:hypothetical protein